MGLYGMTYLENIDEYLSIFYFVFGVGLKKAVRVFRDILCVLNMSWSSFFVVYTFTGYTFSATAP